MVYFYNAFSFKIVVCSWKSVQWLPGVQNDSPVMNTPRRLDCPVVKHRGVSNSCGKYTGESWLPCDEYTGKLTSWCIWKKYQNRLTKKVNSPVYSSPESLDSLVMNTPGSHDSGESRKEQVGHHCASVSFNKFIPLYIYGDTLYCTCHPKFIYFKTE